MPVRAGQLKLLHAKKCFCIVYDQPLMIYFMMFQESIPYAYYVVNILVYFEMEPKIHNNKEIFYRCKRVLKYGNTVIWLILNDW